MSEQEQTFNDGEISLDDLMSGENLFETNSEDLEKSLEQEVEDLVIDEEQEESTLNTTEEGKPTVEKQVEDVINEQTQEEVLEDTETSAYQKAQTLIEMGLLEDIVVSNSEDEEDKGTELSKLKTLTQEQLEFVLENQKEKKDKEIQEKYISKEGLTEHKLKIVEMLKNGLDPNEITTNPDQYLKRPFEGLDLDNPRHQLQIANQYYAHMGLSQKDRKRTLEGLIQDKELESFANEKYEVYQKMFNDNLEKKNQQLIEENQRQLEKEKEIRQNLSAKLKEVKLKDNISKKVIEGVTKKQEDGLREVEKKFKELLENPSENYETLLHILDPKSFKEIYNLKTNKKTTSEILRIVNATPKKSSGKKLEKKKEEFDGIFEKQIENMLINPQT